jgi:uncharacterized membrane protein
MADFRYVVEIQAPPSRVWSVLLDVERWPDWNTSVARVKRMDFGPLTLGSRTRIYQPRLSPAVWKMTSLDESQRAFCWTTRTIGTRILAVHQVEKLGTGSRVTLSLAYAGLLGSFTASLLRNINREYLQREGDGLKRYCEAAVSWPAGTMPATSKAKANPFARSG